MSSLPWRLEKEQFAQLQLGPLMAMVDLGQPAAGLVGSLRLGADLLEEAQLLGVVADWLWADGEVSLPEAHVRGEDLVAAYQQTAYQQTAGRPLRVEALWRAMRPAEEEFMVGVELVVSVRTDAAQSRPELAVQTRLAAGETLRLRDADALDYRRLSPGPEAPLNVRPADGAGCLLFRLPGGRLSYAQMVHPADFQRDELTADPEDASPVCLRHHLFGEPLEKGVILRARVRGVFLPREDDRRRAAACYLAFAASEPPLGS